MGALHTLIINGSFLLDLPIEQETKDEKETF